MSGCTLTLDEARQLKEAWKRMGNERCNHAYLALETKSNQFIFGHYFCMACGEKIPAGKSN